MKYSVLGFNQEAVLNYKKTIIRKVRGIEKEVEIRIDVTDLLLINSLSDFMNRQNIIKSEIEGRNFFWVNYSTVLEDLPILDISKQALSDRLNKLSDFGIIEKKVVLNSMGTFTCFRMGSEYEKIKYSQNSQCNNCDTGSYSTTRGGSSQLLRGVVVNYDPNINILNNNIKKLDTNVSNKESVLEGGDFPLDESNNSIAADINPQKDTRGSGVKKIKKEKSFDVRCDLSYVSDEYRSMWNEWLDYKDEIKKQYKTQTGAKKAYTTWINASDNNPVLANAILQRSIEMSWEGLSTLSEKQKSFFLSDKSPYRDKSITQEIYTPIIPSKYR